MARTIGCALSAGALLIAANAFGLSAATKCEANKLKRAALYGACRLKAESKAVKVGGLPDFSKCNSTFGEKWGLAESGGGGQCPTNGDSTGMQNLITADADLIALKLSGTRFVDHGDGTVTDLTTGLMWEKKGSRDGVANLSDPHDADNRYTWSTTLVPPDGTAFTDFLATLNSCTSADGHTLTGGFAGHCDWRLPTLAELETIVDLSASGCGSGNPCIFSALGPTVAFYYYSVTFLTGSPGLVFTVQFNDGTPNFVASTSNLHVRAVRGGF
jgi:hypothetical protein